MKKEHATQIQLMLIKIIQKQIASFSDNLEFHKYFIENFIVKNQETGKDLLIHFQVKDLDSLFEKLKETD